MAARWVGKHQLPEDLCHISLGFMSLILLFPVPSPASSTLRVEAEAEASGERAASQAWTREDKRKGGLVLKKEQGWNKDATRGSWPYY